MSVPLGTCRTGHTAACSRLHGFNLVNSLSESVIKFYHHLNPIFRKTCICVSKEDRMQIQIKKRNEKKEIRLAANVAMSVLFWIKLVGDSSSRENYYTKLKFSGYF